LVTSNSDKMAEITQAICPSLLCACSLISATFCPAMFFLHLNVVDRFIYIQFLNMVQGISRVDGKIVHSKFNQKISKQIWIPKKHLPITTEETQF